MLVTSKLSMKDIRSALGTGTGNDYKVMIRPINAADMIIACRWFEDLLISDVEEGGELPPEGEYIMEFLELIRDEIDPPVDI